MMRATSFCLLSGLLAGCFGSTPPPPRDHFYRLLVPAPRAETGSRLPGVLLVRPLDADALLRERPILFSADGGTHELQQHDYHYWTDPPPRMIQGQMVDYLSRTGFAASVVTPDLRVESDFEVRGRIKRLERLMGDGGPRVAVELELSLLRRADRHLLINDSFAAELASQDTGMDSSIEAMSTALGHILDRFAAQVTEAQARLDSTD